MTEATRALAAFHAQSYDKDVAPVETLFFGPGLGDATLRAESGPRAPSTALAALREVDAAGPALAGPWSPGARLAAACVEAVRVRRLSPADRYPVHRAYPSPRGLFGADLFLVSEAGAEDRWCLRVDPRTHALRPWGASSVPDDLETALAGARMVVAVDHRRYPPEYGRLRPSLALLEGGHLAATLGLTLARAGLAPRTVFAPEGTPVPEGFAPCAVLTVGPAADGAVVIDPPSLIGVADVAARGASGAGLRRWLDERTSGVSSANLVTSAYVSPDDGVEVTRALVAALAASVPAIPADTLRLDRIVLVEDRVDDRVAVELRPGGAPGPSRPVPRTGETNVSSSLGYTLSVDFAPWARAFGDRAQTALHPLLGWIAQWGCLAAAATGLCARPMRNHTESEWAAVLGLDPGSTPAYQLWVRAERGTYLDLPVDAAP
ncbi:hypothetical protein [Nocardiopsis sp. N85]|uniref:hypothetical protein n=1 Tax=Nocardiopsis sp. N85 TaxID=3029400 RepID=UPI0031588010